MSRRDIFRLTGERNFTLSELAELLGGRLVSDSSQDIQVSALCEHSAHVQPGDLFVAYSGEAVDGHSFVESAFDAGAAAVLAENETGLEGKPAIVVDNGRLALSILSDLFTGHPSRDLKVIGVTGTNGKTTIHWILHHSLNRLDYPNIRIGTLGVRAQGLIDQTSMVTTPSSLEIHYYLREAKKKGMKAAVVESSSHSLSQYRVENIDYDVGVFTNLTPDHLHYHGDMDSYFEAKLKLFTFLSRKRRAGKEAKAAVNSDDEYGRRLQQLLKGELDLPFISFGEAEDAQVRILGFAQSLKSNDVTLGFRGSEYMIRCPYIGAHNASNVAAAFSALMALDFNPQQVADVMQDLPSAPGRLEFFGSSEKVVYVDYAHTADALSHALRTVRPLVKNRLWVLFGAGGDKDPRKRQGMGKVAAELADRIVLTSDNPKKVDPLKIIEEIAEVCEPYFVEVDRGVALEKTLQSLELGDVLLVAGKGHEDYQIVGNEQFHFSDREEVLKHHRAGLF